MSFAISAILLFTVSSDKGTESIFRPRFGPVVFVPFLPHLALLVSHQPCGFLLLMLLSKKLHLKRAGVVEKLGRNLTQAAFPSHHNGLFSLEHFN